MDVAKPYEFIGFGATALPPPLIFVLQPTLSIGFNRVLIRFNKVLIGFNNILIGFNGVYRVFGLCPGQTWRRDPSSWTGLASQCRLRDQL